MFSLCRPDTKIFFGNTEIIREFILAAISERKVAGLPLKTVLIDARGVADIDMAGLDMLQELFPQLDHLHITIMLCNASDQIMTRIESSAPTKKKIPASRIIRDDIPAAISLINSSDYDSSVVEASIVEDGTHKVIDMEAADPSIEDGL